MVACSGLASKLSNTVILSKIWIITKLDFVPLLMAVTVAGGYGKEEPRKDNLPEDWSRVQLHRTFEGLYFLIVVFPMDDSLLPRNCRTQEKSGLGQLE